MRKISKWFGVVLAVSVLLTGCGMDTASHYVKDQYQFESVDGAGSQQQKIYRAANQTVPDTANQIAGQNKPDEMSAKNDENMFLVYPDSVIHVQQDPDKKEDALVEVDTKEYVKQHYDPSFLEGYLAASLISNMFGSNWRSIPHGDYRGYNDYKYRYPSGSSGSKTPSGSYKAPTTPNSGSSGGFVKPPSSSKGSGKVIRRKK
ncbi:MAG: DUF4247 domain-containing protein [Tumebacillaceae bacterium]